MEFIANGAQADLYKNNGKAIKLFKKNISKDEIEYEMNLQKMAFELDLPVPEIYDIVEIDGKFGIIMEYIDGVPIGNIIQKNKNEVIEYLTKSIEIQINLNKIIADNFPPMREKLQRKIISVKSLDNGLKHKTLEILNKINFNKYLCHGDFHVFNLLETKNGIKIIDWVDSSSGNSEADVCRTYLLYKMYSEEIAEMFIETYCKMTRIKKERILNWISIIAAVKLSESIEDINKIEILNRIVKKNVKSNIYFA